MITGYRPPRCRARRIRACCAAFALFAAAGCRTINRAADGIAPPGTVVFSFDDGPNAHGDTTARLLDVLKRHNIKAVFALIGENVEHSPELARRIYAEGHEIINHGYGAKHSVYMPPERFADNLRRGQRAINGAVGAELPPRYRPHGGFYTGRQEAAWKAEGFTLVPATARAYDAVLTAAGREKAVRRIVRAVEKRGGGVILLHDMRDGYRTQAARLAGRPDGAFNRSWIPDAVEELVVILEKKNYRLREGGNR